jgi:crossover junction endodeoxyribonuclease RuvC
MIREFKPKAAAIEGVFVYKNPASAFKLAQARGVILLAAALCDVPVFEYAPQLVKLALTGSGRAEKTQVAYMVGKILGLTEKISLDASDALSLAICHSGQSQMSELPGAPALGNRSRSSSWRRLRPQDLPALGFRVEAKSD